MHDAGRAVQLKSRTFGNTEQTSSKFEIQKLSSVRFVMIKADINVADTN